MSDRKYKIRIRRDSSTNWSNSNPILDVGEIGFETDTYKLKVGNGLDVWNNLNYVSASAAAHNQAISTITGLQTALDSKANTSHSHIVSDVTNLQNALDNKANTVHTHYISDVSSLQASLDAKANTSHSHVISDITSLQGALDTKTNAGHTHYYYEVSPPDPHSGILFNVSGTIGATGWFTYDTGNYKLNIDSPSNAYLSLGSGALLLKGGYENLVLSTGQMTLGSGTYININRSDSHINIYATGLFVHNDLEASGNVTAPFFSGGLLGAVNAPCKNTYGSSIGKGVPVYLTGTVGSTNTIEVSLARADTAASMPAIGVLNQSLANNATGYVTIVGSLKNINTSDFSVGNVIFVGPTGGLTNVRPTSTGHLVQNIGRVGRSNANTGELFILGAGRTNDVPNNLGLDSLYDVVISSPASGQVVFYNGSSWINSAIGSSSGATGATGPAGATGATGPAGATGAIPTGYVISVNSATGVITNVAKTNEANLFTFSQSMPTGIFDSLTVSGGLIDQVGNPLLINAVENIIIGDCYTAQHGTAIQIEDANENIIFNTSLSTFNGDIAFVRSANSLYWTAPGVLSSSAAYTLPAATGRLRESLSIKSATGVAVGTLFDLEWNQGGSKTYAIFKPQDNQPPTGNFATIDTRNTIFVLDFDAATDESAIFTSIMPEAAILASGLKIRIHWVADTATTGSCRWGAQLERMNTDLDSDSFDTAVTAGSTTNGTAGIITTTEIPLSNIDGLVSGEAYRLKIFRDADGTSGTDDMTGDAQLVAVEVRGGA